jgi:ATP-dependent exoDNAse (exonuclease V) beta subunit
LLPAAHVKQTDAATDPIAHAQDLQREGCLLFVACTRARDHLYVSYNGSRARSSLSGWQSNEGL